METIGAIQELINEKAHAKMKKELKALSDYAQDCSLLYDIRIEVINPYVKDAGKPNAILLRNIFDWLDQHIFEVRKEAYIKMESEKFLNDVESLKEQVAELTNRTNE